MYNIIGDIAGRYNELIKLINIMPKNNKIILVGDLVDRGPDSKKVVKWAMTIPNVTTLKGNHEDMMVESYEKGWPDSDHMHNGGRATMKSYGVHFPEDYPKSHIKWMKNLPLFFKDDGLFVSHAPWLGTLGEYTWEHAALWNRYPLRKVDNVFQIHGHNTTMKAYGDWGICIDNSGNKKLTGITFPNKKIYEVAYE